MAHRQDRSSLVYIQRFNVKAGLPHLEVRSIVFFVALLIVVGLAGWLYLHQASEVAARVQQIRRLQSRNQVLQQEILALHSEVAMLGSLKRVQELAARGSYQAPQASSVSSYLLLPYQPGDTPAEPTAEADSLIQGPASPDAVKSGRGLGQRLVDQLTIWMNSSAR